MKKIIIVILLMLFFFVQTAFACSPAELVVQVNCFDKTVKYMPAYNISLAQVQDEVSTSCVDIDITDAQFSQYHQAYMNDSSHGNEFVIHGMDYHVLNQLNARNADMLDCNQYDVLLGETSMMYRTSLKQTCRRMSMLSLLRPLSLLCGLPEYRFSPVLFVWYTLKTPTLTGLLMVGSPLVTFMIIAFAFSGSPEDNPSRKLLKRLGWGLGLFAGVLFLWEFAISFVL